MSTRFVSVARKTTYVIIAMVILTVAAGAILSPFYTPDGALGSTRATQTAVSTYAVPALNLNYLNASQAVRYGIHGMLTIGSLSTSGLNLSVSHGQSLQVPIRITYVCFDSSASQVTASFNPLKGEFVAGSFDVSSLEVFSPSTFIVNCGQSVTTILTIHIPADTSPMAFRLLPAGLVISPSQGIATLFKNDIRVIVS